MKNRKDVKTGGEEKSEKSEIRNAYDKRSEIEEKREADRITEKSPKKETLSSALVDLLAKVWGEKFRKQQEGENRLAQLVKGEGPGCGREPIQKC